MLQWIVIVIIVVVAAYVLSIFASHTEMYRDASHEVVFIRPQDADIEELHEAERVFEGTGGSRVVNATDPSVRGLVEMKGSKPMIVQMVGGKVHEMLWEPEMGQTGGAESLKDELRHVEGRLYHEARHHYEEHHHHGGHHHHRGHHHHGGHHEAHAVVPDTDVASVAVVMPGKHEVGHPTHVPMPLREQMLKYTNYGRGPILPEVKFFDNMPAGSKLHTYFTHHPHLLPAFVKMDHGGNVIGVSHGSSDDPEHLVHRVEHMDGSSSTHHHDPHLIHGVMELTPESVYDKGHSNHHGVLGHLAEFASGRLAEQAVSGYGTKYLNHSLRERMLKHWDEERKTYCGNGGKHHPKKCGWSQFNVAKIEWMAHNAKVKYALASAAEGMRMAKKYCRSGTFGVMCDAIKESDITRLDGMVRDAEVLGETHGKYLGTSWETYHACKLMKDGPCEAKHAAKKAAHDESIKVFNTLGSKYSATHVDVDDRFAWDHTGS